MTVGDRIKKQREALGIAQNVLAEKVGIKKQTLYKYESNIITNVPSDKVEAIADVLRISPAYLMGWIDNLNKDSADMITDILSDAELLENVRKLMTLNPEHREQIYNDILYWYRKEGR